MNKKAFIYSTQNGNFRKDAVYENPRYFEKLPPQGLRQYEEVIVVGEWPLVQAALDAAGVKWRPGDKGDDKGAETFDNTGLVPGASTGSNQGAAMRQKEGTTVVDLARGGPVNEGEGDPSYASVQTTGDGEETVAREQGVRTEDLMEGSLQKELAPGHPHPPLADAGKPEQRPLDEVRQTQQQSQPGQTGQPGSGSTVEIPDNWEDLSWPEQKALAGNFTDEPVTSKSAATKAIKDELKRRG